MVLHQVTCSHYWKIKSLFIIRDRIIIRDIKLFKMVAFVVVTQVCTIFFNAKQVELTESSPQPNTVFKLPNQCCIASINIFKPLIYIIRLMLQKTNPLTDNVQS